MSLGQPKIGSCNNTDVWYLFCELHQDNWHASKPSQWKVRCFEKRARGVPFWTGCIYSMGQSTHKGMVVKIVCKHNIIVNPYLKRCISTLQLYFIPHAEFRNVLSPLYRNTFFQGNNDQKWFKKNRILLGFQAFAMINNTNFTTNTFTTSRCQFLEKWRPKVF